ncbi:hypothetical protein [Undibacterium sp. Di24W]|uniref:hypothetical protein n=1 Tax=Undibacterium sp. Di24W TaxID=3413033 RepID=UPI003BF2A0EC
MIGLRKIQEQLSVSDVEYAVAALRTNQLKEYREGRQAALFCYGMSQLYETKVYFALVELEDFDFIARFVKDDIDHFVPVQLKELTPDFLPKPRTLQDELDKLRKYSRDLMIAFHLNRDFNFNLSDLSIPDNVSSLWFFGAIDKQQTKWGMTGNLASNNYISFEFEYPSTIR